ncbi:spore germination protein [Paenibacillus albicereus]|uniref:Spore germination protein n=1 Tax=Paenibacillus albicereus TaxID=2726185 RepID=A0A6H2GWI9_9BACL|nr:spore germination protein [Paenibacillus albicereus]QJC51536.1 spore germination protein [Paenibacillus albicereus]
MSAPTSGKGRPYRSAEETVEESASGTASPGLLKRLLDKLEGCGDVERIETVLVDEHGRDAGMTLIYCPALIDATIFQLSLLKELRGNGESLQRGWDTELLHIQPAGDEGLYQALFSGAVLIFVQADEEERIYRSDICSLSVRQPDESVMEVSLKGPRDGFVENIHQNVSLVRRRLKTPDLQVELMVLGSQSQTQVSLLYMASLADPSVVETAKKRLKQIQESRVSIESSTQIEALVSDVRTTVFPLVHYTGRPDFAASALMSGRVVIIVDGNPAVILAPVNLAFLIKSPEDLHMPYYFVSLERILRFFGLFMSIFAPGFWIALCAFNTDQLPFSLLATISISRNGLPLSTTMEMFLMLTMFELFKEAGVRLPRAVGQTVSVVGGLIVGNAAIDAGLTSPTMLVVAAVTAVSTYVLVNQTLNGSVLVLRYVVLILSSVLGMFGFFIGMFLIAVHVCSLESFGRPYMAPLATVDFSQMLPSFLQLPWKKRRLKGGDQGAEKA